jgi:hypothetical protein
MLRFVTLAAALVVSSASAASDFIVRPGDEAYDSASQIYNIRVQSLPEAVLEPTTKEEALEAMNYVISQGKVPTFKSGGHHFSGYNQADDEYVLSTKKMRDIVVNDADATITIGGGCVWEEVYRALDNTPWVVSGTTSLTVGVTGSSLGQGYSSFHRKYGFASDNVVQFSVITYNGTMLEATADQNSDLFFALKGAGGGNFGFVVETVHRLHPANANGYLAGEMGFFVPPLWPQVTRTFAEIVSGNTIPEDFKINMVLLNGSVGIIVTYIYFGEDHELGEQLAEELFKSKFPNPTFDTTKVDSFTDYQLSVGQGSLSYPSERRQYTSADFMSTISEEAIDTVLNMVTGERPADPDNFITIIFTQMGGAVSLVASDATAFPMRDAKVAIEFSTGWSSPSFDEEWMQWVKTTRNKLFDEGNVVGTCIGHNDELWSASEYPRMYWGNNYPRLREIKQKYDPLDLFQFPQQVMPPCPGNLEQCVATGKSAARCEQLC